MYLSGANFVDSLRISSNVLVMWEAKAPRKAQLSQPAAGPFGFKTSRSFVPQKAFCRFKRGRGGGESSFGSSIL